MQHYQGQNYKVNRRIKEEVDKNQVNYRESSDDPISIIKRVYIYITDKKGHIIRNATVTIDEETFITGYSGLLISNFPNEEKTITVEKEGYKTATATIIINAETQTHEFFLVLETDDDESEVISTDNTQPKEEFNKCGTLFELSDNNTLVVWAPSKFTNEIVDGVYTGKGSYIEQGWSNKRLWQLDYDIKYNNPSSSYINYYVGVMPFCSEEINPYTDEKRKNYCMESWEKWAAIEGMGAACLEGPKNYKYSKQDEYHHATVKKVAKNKIEYYFDNNKWVYLVPNLPNLETLHFGYRDNAHDRSGGSTTISSKNIKVIGLCTNSEMITLNDTVSLGDLYQFISYNDSEGNEEWGPGIVEIESIPENDELYIGVKVIENEANDSFIGQIFYVKKDAQVGNNIYPLYSDELGTETGIYVSITSLYIEPIELNETVQIDDVYEFKSFGDETGEIEWGEGTVQIKSLPENEDDLYIEVEVKTNSPDNSFVGQTFYILKNAAVGNEIYPLYSDNEGTETGIYVSIIKKAEQQQEEETTTNNNETDIIISTNKTTLSLDNNESAQISTELSPSTIANLDSISYNVYIYDSNRIEYENNYFYIPIDCLDTEWSVDCIYTPTPDIVDENKEVVIPYTSLTQHKFCWKNNSLNKFAKNSNTPQTISEISQGFTGFLRYAIDRLPDNYIDDDNFEVSHLTPKSYFGTFYRVTVNDGWINNTITLSADMIKEEARLKGFIQTSADMNDLELYTSNICIIKLQELDTSQSQ